MVFYKVLLFQKVKSVTSNLTEIEISHLIVHSSYFHLIHCDILRVIYLYFSTRYHEHVILLLYIISATLYLDYLEEFARTFLMRLFDRIMILIVYEILSCLGMRLFELRRGERDLYDLCVRMNLQLDCRRTLFVYFVIIWYWKYYFIEQNKVIRNIED